MELCVLSTPSYAWRGGPENDPSEVTPQHGCAYEVFITDPRNLRLRGLSETHARGTRTSQSAVSACLSNMPAGVPSFFGLDTCVGTTDTDEYWLIACVTLYAAALPQESIPQ